MYDEVQIVMCGVWTWWWAWLWRWAVVVAVAVGVAVAVVVGVVVAVAVTSGGNCARSALTCYCYGCPARFFTREFDSLLCFAGMLAAAAVAGRTSLPANSLVCPVSMVCLLQLQLPDALLYPRILVFSLPRALSVYTSVVIPVSIC